LGKQEENTTARFLEIVKELHLAISKVEMYGNSHPIAKLNVNRAFAFIRENLDSRQSFSLSASDDGTLFADGALLPHDTFTRLFAKDLARRNVRSLLFDERLTLEDFEYLVSFFEKTVHENAHLNIDEYLHRGEIASITANSVEYRLVAAGDEDEPPVEQLASREFLPISAKAILDELSELSDEILRYLSEQGLIRTIGEVLSKGGKSRTQEIFTLDAIIDRHRQILGPAQGAELSKWYDRLRDKHLDRKGEDEPQSASGSRAEFVENLDKFMSALSGGIDPRESRQRLNTLLAKPVEQACLDELEVIYKYLLSTFVRYPTPAFLTVPEVFIGLMFTKLDAGIVNNFAKNRLAEKARETKAAHETEFLTTTLVWLAANYLSRGKLLPALNIARLFGRRRRDEHLPQSLIDDAKTFFAFLCVGEPLESIVSAIDADFFGVPPEIEELIRLIDSKLVTERLLDELANKPRDYAVKIAEMLRGDTEIAGRVFAKEIMQIKHLPRDASGRLATDILLKREANAMFALAIIAGETALPLLTIVAEDTDPNIRFAALEAIARIGTEEAIRTLVKFLYLDKTKWREAVLKLLPRLDPDLVVPVLVRFFHLRREHWIDIIRVVGTLESSQARAFLVDTLYMWNSYTSAMNSYETEEFITALLDSISKCEIDEEARRALKAFLDEWHDFDVLRSFKVLLGSRKDLVTEKARRIISSK